MKTQQKWDDKLIRVIKKINWPFYFIISLYLASLNLDYLLSHHIKTFLFASLLITITYYVGKSADQIITQFLQLIIGNKDKSQDSAIDQTVTNFITLTARVILWLAAGILVLQNLGYQVSAILGGLGVAGIAIGFALKEILVDIFSFFTIYFDKPFETGDFIIIGKDYKGTVKNIGLKSTRIQSLTGQELIIPNTKLAESSIENFRSLEKRRVSFKLSLDSATPVKKIEKLPEQITALFKTIKETELGRVHFTEIGEYALIFDIVYYVLDSDYTIYMNKQQQINLNLMQLLEKQKIELAWPTQKILLDK